MTPENVALTYRVARLEQENRRLKMAGIAVAILLAMFVFEGADKPRAIEAEKIVLRDSHGRARLTIGTPASAGAAIDLNSDDPVVWLSDDRGTDRAMLTIGGLFFANGKSRPTVSLTSDVKPGMSSLKFHGPDGKVSWSAP